jgi:hypothetical protein
MPRLGALSRLLVLLVGLALAPRAQASSFDVFCTDNSDGTQTCVGWEGGEALTCIRSRGSTISCSAPSGRSFTCIQALGGVISCSNPPNTGRRTAGPRCVPAGDGSLVCEEEDPPSAPLLQAPGLPSAAEPLDAPALAPLLPGSLSLPSVFD